MIPTLVHLRLPHVHRVRCTRWASANCVQSSRRQCAHCFLSERPFLPLRSALGYLAQVIMKMWEGFSGQQNRQYNHQFNLNSSPLRPSFYTEWGPHETIGFCCSAALDLTGLCSKRLPSHQIHCIRVQTSQITGSLLMLNLSPSLSNKQLVSDPFHRSKGLTDLSCDFK